MILLNNETIFPIGFGCGPLGVHGFGKVDLTECRKAVQMAVTEGINFFDTSDAYGKGLSEEQLCLALGNQRKDVLISSKGSIRFDNNNKVFYDCSPTWLKQALEQSLKRLKTDYIDLYQIHYWDKITPLEEIFGFMEDLCSEGKIRAYGVSNIDLSKRSNSFFMQFPNLKSHSNEFSMIRQQSYNSFNELLNKQPDSFFLSSGVLAQGLLTGKYSIDSTFPDDDRRSKSNYRNLDKNFINIVIPLINTLKNQKYKPATLAIAWTVETLNRSIALVGIKSRTQLKDALSAREIIKGNFNWDDVNTEIQKIINNVQD